METDQFQAGGPLKWGSITRVCLLTLTEIIGGAPLLAPFEKEPALSDGRRVACRTADSGVSSLLRGAPSIFILRTRCEGFTPPNLTPNFFVINRPRSKSLTSNPPCAKIAI